MARSKKQIPHYYLSTTVDLAAATRWLRAANEGARSASFRPGAAAAEGRGPGRTRRPEGNGFWVRGAYRPSESVHLGMAVSLRAVAASSLPPSTTPTSWT